MELMKTEWSNARGHGPPADASADASAAASPSFSSHSRRPCRHRLRRSDSVVVLRGRALVRVARLRGSVLENTEPSVGNLHGFCSGHISHSVRIVLGFKARASPRFAERF